MLEVECGENAIIDKIENVFNKTAGSELCESSLPLIKEEIQILSAYWNCTDEQSLILAILIYKSIINDNVSVKAVIDHINLKISYAKRINEVLENLVKREWLFPKNDVAVYPLTDYSLARTFIKATLSNQPFKIVHSPIETAFDILSRFQLLLNRKKDKQINYSQLLLRTESLIQENKGIKWAKFILDEEIDAENIVLYLLFCLKYYNGNTHYELSSIIYELSPGKLETYNLRNQFTDKNLSIFNNGLIVEGEADIYDTEAKYHLTEKGLKAFDEKAPGIKDGSNYLLTQIEPQKIVNKQLIFDKEEEKGIYKLHDMLSIEHYGELKIKLAQQGMKTGISILLYGHPGTGKTETVYQIAKTSERIIYSADASKIRSKWLGQSEKNLRKLFEEYRGLMKKTKNTPILLFNEADGIMGKRQKLSDRGDQMENTLQNILLEELENFEGIFIATTNMVSNFDKAFDRRFLYKVRFEKPKSQAIYKIWKDKFPKVSKTHLKQISTEYSLTGAQIENIKKKTSIDSILNAKIKITNDYLRELAKQELLLETSNTKSTPIGFVSKNNQ
jgi:predicted transcriptional regulator